MELQSEMIRKILLNEKNNWTEKMRISVDFTQWSLRSRSR